MERLYELTKDADAALIRDAFEESRTETETILKVLEFENTPVDLLVEIGEMMPWHDVHPIARKLSAHPNLTDEAYARVMTALKNQWWGDDPTECRLAWEAFEKYRAEQNGRTDIPCDL